MVDEKSSTNAPFTSNQSTKLSCQKLWKLTINQSHKRCKFDGNVGGINNLSTIHRKPRYRSRRDREHFQKRTLIGENICLTYNSTAVIQSIGYTSHRSAENRTDRTLSVQQKPENNMKVTFLNPRGGRRISSSAFLSRRPFGYYLPIASYGIIFAAKWSSNGGLQAEVSK